MTVRGDNPITDLKDDALGRAGMAKHFAEQILSLDVSGGVVVGVLGPWGSGKTSFVNLAREPLSEAGVEVLDFNPWMFSGTEQLLESFFVELAAQLKLRPSFAEIGKDFAEYGELFSTLAWLPVLGPWIARGRGLAQIVRKRLERRTEGVSVRRRRLEKALSDAPSRIVVVLDDIDRLSTAEIRDVFRLVRLTANFPNIIYLLAFDRARVEGALEEQGVLGRDYLEKILQLAFDLPAITPELLAHETLQEINSAISGIESPGPFDEQLWPDIYAEILQPLIRNMRDVRRYASSLRGTVIALEGQIALPDVLGIEAVRLFLPDVFNRLHGSVEALTKTSEMSFSHADETESRTEIEALCEAGGRQEGVVRAMLARLFPAAQHHVGGSHYGSDWSRTWLRERRIGSGELLRLYLERVATSGLQAFTESERAWQLMADEDAFDGYLRSIDRDRLGSVISSLEAFEEDFAREHVVPGVIVLLNIWPKIPDRPGGLFDFGPRHVVGRITYRLLRSLGDTEAVESAVREILPRLQSLSAKSELITDIGYRENAGHKLASEEAAAALELEWRHEVRSASVTELVEEHDLLRVLALTKRESSPGEAPLVLDPSPELALALIRSGRSVVTSQSMGSRAVSHSPRLPWDLLVELYGGEEMLRQAVESAKAITPEEDQDLLRLADKYLSGWRPRDLEDD